MLKLSNVQSYYGNIAALKGIDLEIQQGEIVTLIGANGAGKSTALMSICGVLPPRQGEILFQGKAIQKLAADQIVARGLVQVPEGRRIFHQLTVRENLDLGAYLRSDKEGIAEDLDYVFSLFPILEERASQPGGTMSGGEQQMLAVARGLMARPKLLLLDEPSMGLAPLVIKQIFQIIEKINKEQGTTIFLVEQNANQALHLANRGYVIENGKIILSDSADKLLNNEQVKEAYLGI